jgi:hypothetical protein
MVAAMLHVMRPLALLTVWFAANASAPAQPVSPWQPDVALLNAQIVDDPSEGRRREYPALPEKLEKWVREWNPRTRRPVLEIDALYYRLHGYESRERRGGRRQDVTLPVLIAIGEPRIVE